MVPDSYVHTVSGIGGGEEAESEVPTVGDEHVSWEQWLCLCQSVGGLTARTQEQEDQEDENWNGSRAHVHLAGPVKCDEDSSVEVRKE